MVEITNIGNMAVSKSVSAPTTASGTDKGEKSALVKIQTATSGKPGIEPKDVGEVVVKVNDGLKQLNTNLRIDVDSASGRVVIKLMDKETDKVVRQIPSEEMLAVARHLNEAIESYSRDPNISINIFNNL